MIVVARFHIFQIQISVTLMTVKAMRLCIKVAELNTLLVGKGITGIPSTGFNEIENKNTKKNAL